MKRTNRRVGPGYSCFYPDKPRPFRKKVWLTFAIYFHRPSRESRCFHTCGVVHLLPKIAFSAPLSQRSQKSSWSRYNNVLRYNPAVLLSLPIPPRCPDRSRRDFEKILFAWQIPYRGILFIQEYTPMGYFRIDSLPFFHNRQRLKIKFSISLICMPAKAGRWEQDWK